jgi:DNA polymerase III gamma/tau subunit
VYIYITTNELCPFPLKLLICHILICFDILLQIGDVSDEELLDLLNLAMSSDAATVVRRAREVLSSKVDPLQLLAQLANLIMDILAGKHQSDSSEVRRVTGKHTCMFFAPLIFKIM